MFDTVQELFEALCEPFPPEYIEWRVGSTSGDKSKGLALAYIDARCVMDRLDSVCGPDGWQNKHIYGPNGSVLCELSVRMPDGEWLIKTDGAGATDVEAEKGSISDSLKRAAVRWGVGRYLYELDSPWVELEPAGKSYRIKKSEFNKLADLHDEHARKCGWGTRSNVQAYKVLNQSIKHWVTSADKADEFREQNKGMLAQLPVAMRRHLSDTLDRIGSSHKEAAE